MALFPAYACGDVDLELNGLAASAGADVASSCPVDSAGEASSGAEARLLASDSDGEPTCRAVRAPPSPPHSYYVDVRQERGNLAVSTLYYPGRPQYRRTARLSRRAARETRALRYYETVTARDNRAEERAAREAREGRFLRALADTPRDESLWLHYIEFEEGCREGDGEGGGEATLRAAERAVAALPESRVLRAALHRARVRALPPSRLLAVLREATATALEDHSAHLESWLRLLAALATTASPDEVADAASRALVQLRRVPTAYPHVLYAYGAFLRDAGLWERLVLLVELVAAMNFPAGAFPPDVPDAAFVERLDRELADLEDKAIGSELPSNTVWVRVERARAAAHWRPARPADTDPDPQRRALPADVADLLLPLTDPNAAFLLSVQLLRLAKVPLFPPAEYVRRAFAVPTEEDLGAGWEASGAEAFLPLIRAARRLPGPHPARPARASLARDLMGQFLDPPHYLTDRAGYLSWVSALWEACCEWATAERRLALLCWRLRWLHALLLLAEDEEGSDGAEVRRILSEARGALKRHAGGAPIAFAQFARIQLVAAGAERAAQTALQAVRAALGEAACPAEHRLYAARVAGEVGGAGVGRWAVVCAALGVPLPACLDTPPDAEVVGRALQQCEEQCAAAEARWAEGAGGAEGVCAALLPGAGEWAGARAALAPPARVRRLLGELLRRCGEAQGGAGEEQRYLEQSACGIACAGARDHRLVERARLLAPHFPHCGLLALASSGAALSAWETRGEGTAPAQRLRALEAAARTHTAALAHLLPALWRALSAAWQPREAERVRRACGRAGRRGCGGALLHAVALEAEARAPGPRAREALLRALERLPNHKWLYVRGAAWCAGEAAALPDVLLERQLRLHALRDELAPTPTTRL